VEGVFPEPPAPKVAPVTASATPPPPEPPFAPVKIGDDTTEFAEPPPPPPVEVMVEKTESVPFVPLDVMAVEPGCPAPTVTV
jgi:hypothetical protein